MAELIEKQAAIDAVKEYGAFMMEYSEDMSKEDIAENAIRSAKKTMLWILKELPSAQPEPQWIPCSERLPEEKINQNTKDFEKVLCTTAFGDVRAYAFGTPIGTKEPHFWNGPECVDKYVVAWQYMPKPYQEEI